MTDIRNNPFYNSFLLALFYGLSLYFIQFALQKAGIVGVVPDSVSLLRYDAGVYEGISRTGYVYTDAVYNNSGCYWLFPMLWRVLHVGIVGMSIINIVLFSIGFGIINQLCTISSAERLLWLSTPSLYFMAVPYSEALFFLLAALLFYGIVKERKWLICGTLFLLALTRASALFLLPALLLMEVLANRKSSLLKSIRHYLLLHATPVLMGTAAFVLIQYVQTGVWFAYFKQQENSLGHKWAWPTFPLKDALANPGMNWLSGLAVMTGILAIVLLARHMYQWLRRGQLATNKLFTLASSYLFITLFSVVFCSPTWVSNTTNLTGLHRYIFATPFMFIFLKVVAGGETQYKLRHFVAAFIVCNAAFLLMGSYLHIQTFLFWNCLTLLVFVYMLCNNYYISSKFPWVSVPLIAFNALVQMSLFQAYLGNIYTD